MSMIHPHTHADADTSTSSATTRPDVVYVLCASTALPVIDCSKTLKRVVLNHSWLVRYNAFQRATKRVLPVSFALGLALSAAQLFLPRRVNQWNAIISTSLLIVPILTSYMMLRVDMLVLLAKSYEFWYVLVVSLVSNTLVALNLGDLRAIVAVSCTLMFQYTLMIDASARDARAAIVASASGAVVLAVFVLLQVFDLVQDYGNVVLVDLVRWRLCATDVVVNGLSMIVVVQLRNAYRKHRAIAHMSQARATVRCISYRTRIHLAPLPLPPPLSWSLPLPCEQGTSRCTPLRFVSSTHRFHADDFVAKWLLQLPHDVPSVWRQRCWTSVAIIGLVATSMAVMARPQRTSLASWWSVTGFLCTAAYTARCAVFHNRALLQYMLVSFDFVFLATQSLAAHAVLCHLLQWHVAHCLPVVSSALWMHWVFTLDLLTPLVRQRLGLASSIQWLALAVLVLAIVGHVFLTVKILLVHRWQMNDRVLFQFKLPGTATVAVTAVPFLLTRMATTFCWSLRLTWRLSKSILSRGEGDGQELLLIHGAVEYDDADAAARRHRRVIPHSDPRSYDGVGVAPTGQLVPRLVCIVLPQPPIAPQATGSPP